MSTPPGTNQRDDTPRLPLLTVTGESIHLRCLEGSPAFPAHLRTPEPAAELRPAGSGTATAPRSRRHERPRSPRVPGPAFLTRGRRASPRRVPSAPPGPAPAGGAGLSRPPPRLAHLSPAPRLGSAGLSSAARVGSGPSFRPVFPPNPREAPTSPKSRKGRSPPLSRLPARSESGPGRRPRLSVTFSGPGAGPPGAAESRRRTPRSDS